MCTASNCTLIPTVTLAPPHSLTHSLTLPKSIHPNRILVRLHCVSILYSPFRLVCLRTNGVRTLTVCQSLFLPCPSFPPACLKYISSHSYYARCDSLAFLSFCQHSLSPESRICPLFEGPVTKLSSNNTIRYSSATVRYEYLGLTVDLGCSVCRVYYGL